MNETPWFLYANVLVWLGLGGYLALLGAKAARLEARLRRLEHAARSTARDEHGADGA